MSIQGTRAERFQLLLEKIAHGNGRLGEHPKSHPKTPCEQRGGIAPNAGFAVTENHHDDVGGTSRSAADQAVTGSFGITGLHPVAIRKASEDFVSIFELPR